MPKLKVNIKSRQMLPRYTDEELTEVGARVGLSLENLKALHRAGNATWQTIGYDIINASGGKDIPREEVVECVLDANYIDAYGAQHLNPELKEWLNRTSRTYELDWVYAAMAAGFPFSRYGL